MEDSCRQEDILNRILAFLSAVKNIDSIFIDGGLYVGMAVFTALSAMLSTDEAAKFVEPTALFWARGFCTVNSAWMLSLKMFRSSHYSEYRKEKANGNGAQPTITT